MASKWAAVVVALVAASSGIWAQSSAAADEAAIRERIGRYDRGERTGLVAEDLVFWSSAYQRPTVGNERGIESKDIQVPLDSRVAKSQRNKTAVVRIVIAKSGDLAYEYSNGELSFDTKDGRHVSIPQAILRTWQKEGTEWKIAAMFTRRIE